ncbi:aldo/keto reductase [Saccharicrinis sp. FJH62]|uniref:aldo/keto reductase n=1 Tax=Saccharicrinis sp. FJH62 TaxID=3344657 RepID=UPI0035D3DF16
MTFIKPKYLGKTNIECPPIIYGTSYLGNLYRELSWKEKLALMKEWFNVADGKKVVIDSAGKYGAGLSLETIGKGLKELGVDPLNITISNKLGWYRIPLTTDEPSFEPGAWINIKHDAVQKISYEGILECWKQGSELLGDTYKSELVSVHDPDEYLAAAKSEEDRKKRFDDVLGAYKALFELKKKKKVKAVGIGSKDWKVIYELYQHVKFDWIMFANSFTVYSHPGEVLDFFMQLEKDGVGIINSGIFNAGFLTGGAYFDYRLVDVSNPLDQHLFEWREKFYAVCDTFNVVPGDACLQFAYSPKPVNAVALNPGKPTRMARNKIVIVRPMPYGFWEALKEEKIIDPAYPFL